MSSLAGKQSTEPMPLQPQQVNGNCLPVGGPVRLMLGGRDHKLAGWTNIDLHDGPHVDVKCDVSKLPFDNSVVDDIYASHVLEHFSHLRTLDVLKEWRRVLKKGGKAYIAVPDFRAVLNIYKEFGMVTWVTHMLYGDQEYPLAYHYTIFDSESLPNLLHEAGFSLVQQVQSFSLGLNDCSTLVDVIYRRPVSLNVEAIA
jgi:predicted SAM-dependent methyltransferase